MILRPLNHPMPEHRIQLRRAWVSEGDGPPRRLDLPFSESQRELPGRIARVFNRPRIDDGEEILSLEFLSIPGLLAAHLNGQDLNFPKISGGSWIVPVPDLRARANRLVLTIDSAEARLSDAWGQIALVIRRADP